jgi:glycosyltransferase involved in cell wall biosynthesis
MTDRILLFVPMYNCERQIGRVLAQITPEHQRLLAEVMVVDNRSTDGGREVAIEALRKMRDVPTRLVRNDNNYGLGGSHKTAFHHALKGGFDYLIVLHGDDQGDFADIAPYLRDRSYAGLDALLGARFMKGSKLVGYSTTRRLGNRVFNALYSAATGVRIHDLGSGLNMYRVGALADRFWLGNANDLTFNYHMILRSIAAGWRMQFFPLSWREDDQVSNVKLVQQSLRVLRLPLAYRVARRRYLARDFSGAPDARYTAEPLYVSDGTTA